ncbi:translation initiation factor IF-2, mitochondrial [Bacillus rossius redtenbacheri]|uniref:translation initiation factor IF-2, mitochondrial n=1 Tax=Bacillus rossius redtenbacheri TaxID=93214 RepID=UPI002FDCA67B
MAASLMRIFRRSLQSQLLVEVALPWRGCAGTVPAAPGCCACRLLHVTAAACKRRKTAEERKAPKVIQYSPKPKVQAEVVHVWNNMTVQQLAEALHKNIDHVFEAMVFVDNSSDYSEPYSVIDNPQVIKEIVRKSGMKFRFTVPPELQKTEEVKNKDAVKRPPPDPSVLVKRPPVVTIMGHVDHGKTTLLDSLRHTSVVQSEFGGITQHIGAFSVKLDSGEEITFLDTPGHAAFSAMRARGASVTDLVVLVVAADDGVMEQTVESIRMAREARVPIVVAINKIDRPEADIERAKRMLVQHGIQVEDAGGDVQVVPISALHGTNLDLLMEAIVLQAELMNLRGDPRGPVEGVVIESKTDPYRGKLSTALVKRGTLRKGCVLVSGLAWAKVRAMFNERGQHLEQAPPSTPVEVLGWRELPSPGDELLEVESERRAHEVMRWRESQQQAMKMEAAREVVEKKAQEHMQVYKANLEKKRMMGRYKLRPTGPRKKEYEEDDSLPKVGVIVKGDVDGSVEAILDVLETYDCNADCELNLVHYGVGIVSETDVELAEAFNAIIYAFNTQIPDKIKSLAKRKGVTIKPHNVIYRLFEDVKKEINSRLPLKPVEDVLGEATVLQEFRITEGKKKVSVAGCRCTKGVLKKSARYRVLRAGEVIHEGTLASMRHLKNEVDSVKKDVECGLRFVDDSVGFEPGDVLQCYSVRHIEQETRWDPGF